MSRFHHAPPDRPGWQARLLAPIATFRAYALKRRRAAPAFRAEVPIITLEPLTGRFPGQTEAALAVAQLLGGDAHLIVPGPGMHRVDGTQTDPEITAEALILGLFQPVWQTPDPVAGLRAAQAAGAPRAMVVSDGPELRVAADKRVLLVDATRGFGNGRLWPAGPLHAPLALALADAAAVLAIGPADAQARFAALWAPALGGTPLFTATLGPLETGMSWQGLRVLAVTGAELARDFLPALKGTGAQIVSRVVLDGTQPLASTMALRLQREAANLGAQLVTTETEAMRLPPALRRAVLSLPLRATLADPAGMRRVLTV
jgi:tetraacyldisaccharide 4'-kinase